MDGTHGRHTRSFQSRSVRGISLGTIVLQLMPTLVLKEINQRKTWHRLPIVNFSQPICHKFTTSLNVPSGPVLMVRALALKKTNSILRSSVTDSLDYQPEKATVLAVYKKVVVGVAILKSPEETYIMYLAVKAGWDKSQIARFV